MKVPRILGNIGEKGRKNRRSVGTASDAPAGIIIESDKKVENLFIAPSGASDAA